MNIINLAIGLTLNMYASTSQILKIVKLKNSNSVSLNGFIVTCVGLTITSIMSETPEIFIMSIFGLILAIISSFIVHKYRTSKYYNKESKIVFAISLFASFFMIMGVAQAIKSYNTKGTTDEISKSTWCVWIIFLLNSLVMANSVSIIFANIITLCVIFFVLIKCFFPLNSLERGV